MKKQDNLAWVQLEAGSEAQLASLQEEYGIKLESGLIQAGDAAGQVLSLTVNQGRLVSSWVSWSLNPELNCAYTAELGVPVLYRGFARSRLKGQGLDPKNGGAVLIVLFFQLLRQAEAVQEILEYQTAAAADETQEFLLTMSSKMARGIEDLKSLDADLNLINAPESLLMLSLFDLDHSVRRVRRKLKPGSKEYQLADDLLGEIDGMVRKTRFAAGRRRFHFATAGSAVTSGNLSINKLFNALWAVTIPGTVLINWYGENFRVMPELSWSGTMPLQLIGTFLITILPIWIVKTSGAMR